VKITAYFLDCVTEEDRELIRCVGTEVIADFPEEYSIEESCLSIEESKLKMLDSWAFLRKGYSAH
jgi:hypothetical protein